jgi:hypothetical protein
MSLAERPAEQEWQQIREARAQALQEAAALRSGVQEMLVQAAGVVRQAMRHQEQQDKAEKQQEQ